MRTSVFARTLIAALAAAFALNGAVQAAEPPSAPPVGATVRESQDSTLANANANATRGSSSAAAIPASTAGYVPKTKYDNTPYRFNAGKRFTAAEFDAWMKSRGIRVAKGVPAAASSASSGQTAPAAAGTTHACGTTGADTSAC